MQRWEYTEAYQDPVEPQRWHVRGGVLAGSAGVNAQDVLSRLGDEGWELVAVVGSDWLKYYFKRPKE